MSMGKELAEIQVDGLFVCFPAKDFLVVSGSYASLWISMNLFFHQ